MIEKLCLQKSNLEIRLIDFHVGFSIFAVVRNSGLIGESGLVG